MRVLSFCVEKPALRERLAMDVMQKSPNLYVRACFLIKHWMHSILHASSATCLHLLQLQHRLRCRRQPEAQNTILQPDAVKLGRPDAVRRFERVVGAKHAIREHLSG